MSMWQYDPEEDIRATARAAVEAEARREYDPTLLMHPTVYAELQELDKESPCRTHSAP